MSDSDSDCNVQSRLFTFQNQNIVSVRGPNINHNVMMDIRSNTMASHRSMQNRKGGSPFSVRSNMITSHRSIHNGRSGSIFSERTVDSHISNVSARDIAEIFKTTHFNKSDLRIIHDAYNKYMKNQRRRRIEKRRNLRRFMRGVRRKSGGYSGEESSDSSLSNDCGRSTRSYKSGIFRENPVLSSSYSRRLDLEDFKKTLLASNIYKDCTNIIKRNSLKNVISNRPRSIVSSSRSIPSEPRSMPSGPKSIPEIFTQKPEPQKPNKSLAHQNQSNWGQNQSVMSQKERFASSFLLPSQRFHHSTSMSVTQMQLNKSSTHQNQLKMRQNQNVRYQKDILSTGPLRCEYNTVVNNTQDHCNQKTFHNFFPDSESEQEQISYKTTDSVQDVNKSKNKRKLEDTGDSGNNKIKKLATPQTKKAKSKAPSPKVNRTLPVNDFVFAKPQLPIRKINNKNSSVANNQRPVNKSYKTINNIDIQNTPSVVEEIISSNCKNIQNLPVIEDNNVSNSHHQLESIISKSQSVSEKKMSYPKQNIPKRQNDQVLAKSSETINKENLNCQNKDEVITETTDVSIRPSFIKRKLFSQKFDEGDNKNYSSDCVEGDNPPSDVYSEIQKEKNRTRKLVMSQSCLSRDVLKDESNLLDLIQKIVPSDRLNATAINRPEIDPKSRSKSVNATTALNRYEANKKSNNDSKWKVDEVIASCDNISDISSTYTDEEIFGCNEDNIKKKATESCTSYKYDNVAKINYTVEVGKHKESLPECVIAIEKLPLVQEDHVKCKSNAVGFTRNLVQCVKSFWDTDFESDVETRRTPLKRSQPLNKSKQASSTRNISKNKKEVAKSSPVKNVQQKNLKSTILCAKLAQNSKPCTKAPSTENKKNDSNNNFSAAKKKDKNSSETTSKLNGTISKTTTVPNLNKNKKTPKKPNEKIILDDNLSNNNSTETTSKLNGTISKTNMVPNLNKNRKPAKKSNEKIIFDNNLSNILPQCQVEAVNKSKKFSRTLAPKVKLCCTDSRKNNNSLDDTIDTVYRNLRSRKINLTTSTASNGSPEPGKRKTAVNKNKKLTEVSKNLDNSQSDLSFTLKSCKHSAANKIANTTRSQRLNLKKANMNESASSANSTVNRSTTISLRPRLSKPKRMW